MNLLCTAISTLWLLFARSDLPYITVADSFMAVLFAQVGSATAASEAPPSPTAPAAAFSRVF